MINVKFNKFNKLFNYNIFQKDYDRIIYTDTDSMFIKLPYIDDKISNIIENFTIEVGKKLAKAFNNNEYIENFDNLLLKIRFKQDYAFKNVIFYGKKSYLGIKIDGDELKPVLTGVEGKRNTAKYIKDIVDDLIEYLIKVEPGEEDFSSSRLYRLYKEYESRILKIKTISDGIDYLGFPLNLSTRVEDLKSIQAQYRGAITFDVISNKIMNLKYWSTYINGKGIHLYVKPKDLLIVNEAINEFQKYDVIKMDLDKKSADTYIKDITIPVDFIEDKKVLKAIDEYFDIDYKAYLDKLKSKFKLMYYPLNKEFCDKLITPNRLNYMHIYNINDENYFSSLI